MASAFKISIPYEENPHGGVTLRLWKGDAEQHFRCHSAVLVHGGAIAVTIHRDQLPIYVSAGLWDYFDVPATCDLDPGS